MSSLSIELKILNLRKEYRRYSKYILYMQNHINRCLYEHLLNDHTRNQYFKKLNENLRKMNDKYNTYINPFFVNRYESECDEMTDTETLDKMYEDIYFHEYISKHMENIEENTLDIDIFEEIRDDLLEIGSKIGFYNITMGLELIIGKVYRKMQTNNIIDNIDFYNDIFIPLSYSTEVIGNSKYCNFCITETDKTFQNLLAH